MKQEMASLFGTPKPDPTKTVIKPKTKKELQAFRIDLNIFRGSNTLVEIELNFS